MENVKILSSFSDWETATSNRIKFKSEGTGSLQYLDHDFQGLSLDEGYWKIIDYTGDSLAVNDSLGLIIEDGSGVSSIRSSDFLSGDFDISVPYFDFYNNITSGNAIVFFEASSYGVDSVSNISFQIGLGKFSGNDIISCRVIKDGSSLLFSQSFVRTLDSGLIRIKRTSSLIEFYEDGSITPIASFSDPYVSSYENVFLNFFSEDSLTIPLENVSVYFDSIEIDSEGSYSGDIIYDTELDISQDTLYYTISAILGSEFGNIAIRVKSSDTEAGLDLAVWSAYSYDPNGSFPIYDTNTFFRTHILLETSKYDYSPILNSVSIGDNEYLQKTQDINVVSPVSNEVFDVVMRVMWEKPVIPIGLIGKVFYSISYKNNDLGVTDWILVDGKVDIGKGYYDWEIMALEESDNYEIKIDSVFDDSIPVSEGLPTVFSSSNAGILDFNGVFRLVGFHNGENLYSNDLSYAYFNGEDKWLMNYVIDNVQGYYCSDDLVGQWDVQIGIAPAPFVEELDEDGGGLLSSSFEFESSLSYDFSSTSSSLSSSSLSSSSSSFSSQSSSSSSFSSASSSSSPSQSSDSSSSNSSSTQFLSTSSSSNSSSSSSKSSGDAVLYGTGNNEFGQLSLMDFENRFEFTHIETEDEYYGVKKVEVGSFHTIIEKSDGSVWVVGRNEFGQLGLGDNFNRYKFVKLSSFFDNPRSIGCGINFSVIQVADGSIWTTGDNSCGQLAMGDYVDRNVFTNISGGFTNSPNIWMGGEHWFLKRVNGWVYGVGRNDVGQLGSGDYDNKNVFFQTTVSEPKIFATGANFSYYLKEDGSTYSTGNNESGQLCTDLVTKRNSFDWVDTDIVVVSNIIAGGEHVIIIDESDKIYGCGDNTLGQLGLGDNEDRFELTYMGITSVDFVRAGFHHTFVQRKSADVYSTGYNAFGQLGITGGDQYSFVEVPKINGSVDIICGTIGYHTISLSSESEDFSSESFEMSYSSDYYAPIIDIDLPYGFFETSPTNLSDLSGYMEGSDFILTGESNRILLHRVSSSMLSNWKLQIYDVVGENYVDFMNLTIGEIIPIMNIPASTTCRVVTYGDGGLEVYSYTVSFGIDTDIFYNGLSFVSAPKNHNIISVVNWTDSSGTLDLASLTGSLIPEGATHVLLRASINSGNDDFTSPKKVMIKKNDFNTIPDDSDLVATNLRVEFTNPPNSYEGSKGEKSNMLVVDINNSVSENLSWRMLSDDIESAPLITTLGWNLYIEGYFIQETIAGTHLGKFFEPTPRNYNTVAVPSWDGSTGSLDFASLTGSAVPPTAGSVFITSNINTESDNMDESKVLYISDDNIINSSEDSKYATSNTTTSFNGDYKSDSSASFITPLNNPSTSNVLWRMYSYGLETSASITDWNVSINGYFTSIGVSPTNLGFIPLGKKRTQVSSVNWEGDSGFFNMQDFGIPDSSTYIMIRLSWNSGSTAFDVPKQFYIGDTAFPSSDIKYKALEMGVVYDDGKIRGDDSVTLVVETDGSGQVFWELSSGVDTAVISGSGISYSIEGYFVSP
jgi:alpha-tubulin suppressor-like RCC1 family protein